MNCNIVTMTYENGMFYATYQSKEKFETADNKCDSTQVGWVNINLEIQVHDNKTGGLIDNNGWSAHDVTMKVEFTKDATKNKSEIKSITWKNNVTSETIDINGDFDSNNTKAITEVSILNTTYEAKVTFNDGTIYYAKRNIKIDKQNPLVYGGDIEVENAASWTNKNKKVKVVASDGNGSGIAGYYIGPSSDCNNVKYERCADI